VRIGLGCTTIEPTFTQGKLDGIGFYTKHLLDEMMQLHQSVTPYIFPPLKRWRMASTLPQGKTLLPYIAATSLSLCLPMLPVHAAIEKNIDVFHSTDYLVPKFKKTPVVATLNDAVMLMHPEWYYRSRLSALKNAIRKANIQWADHVIAISESVKKEIIEFWRVKEEKISVVYDGIDAWWFEKASIEDKHAIREKYHLPENFILVVGTLQPRKNISRIIEAFLALPADIREHTPLVIVGKAGWSVDASLTAIAKLIASGTGYWLQYLPNDDVRTLFQAARLHLHPSLHEGFGFTILQAYASETPLITSNITAMPEIAGDAAMLVDPYSPEEIKQAILKIITSPALSQELIEKGKRRVKDFSWEKCARETLAVYGKSHISY